MKDTVYKYKHYLQNMADVQKHQKTNPVSHLNKTNTEPVDCEVNLKIFLNRWVHCARSALLWTLLAMRFTGVHRIK